MAYLTKPEGIGFLFIFLLWLICIKPPATARRNFFARIWMAVLAVMCFTFVSLPYLVQIRNDLGSWQLSKKAGVSVGVIQSDYEDGTRETNQQYPKRRVDISAYVRSPFSLMAKVSLGFLESLGKFQQGFTPYLLLFAIVGFLRRINGKYPWKPNCYVLSHVVFFFGLILPFFWITKRYTSQMIPMILPWAAWGFLGIVSWLSWRFDYKQVHVKGFNFLCIGIVILALLAQGILSTGRGHRQIQKDVGLWMKASLPRESKFMSRLPQEGFYAQMEWARIRKGSYAEIISDARSQGAEYLIIDDVVLRNVRDFRENIPNGDLILVKEWKKGSRQIILFQGISSVNR
jgi:hypothetical protein